MGKNGRNARIAEIRLIFLPLRQTNFSRPRLLPVNPNAPMLKLLDMSLPKYRPGSRDCRGLFFGKTNGFNRPARYA